MPRLTDAETARLHPETLALSYGFDPWLSEGAIKPPVFLTSTFAFRQAADGKQFFAWAHSEGHPPHKADMGLIYSRINNPNLEIFEDRIALWEGMRHAESFSSGMAAIATTLLATHQPGDEMIVCAPVYGGTDSLIHHFLKRYGLVSHFIPAGVDAPALAAPLLNTRTRSIFIESPANPNNRLTDIGAMKALAVSLGSTESLAEHPAAMTRSGLTREDKQLGGITDNLIRLSIGIEHPDDLLWNLQALEFA